MSLLFGRRAWYRRTRDNFARRCIHDVDRISGSDVFNSSELRWINVIVWRDHFDSPVAVGGRAWISTGPEHFTDALTDLGEVLWKRALVGHELIILATRQGGCTTS